MPRVPGKRSKSPEPITFVSVECQSMDEVAHLWLAIANYQAYRKDDPEVDFLPPDHPLCRLQNMITEQLPELIGTGIAQGWNVGKLAEIQNALTSAIRDEKGGRGFQL